MKSRTLLVVALISAWLGGCEGRNPAPRGAPAAVPDTGATESTVLEFDLSQGVPESTMAGGWFPLPAARTFTGLVRSIERAAADRETKALFLRFGSRRIDFAKAEELGALLASFKQHKPVYCHAHTLANATLWVTLRGCTKTFLSPAGDVEAIGLGAKLVYFKGLLDKLGVEADFLAIGKYKSAAESFLRDSPSDAAREEWLETLGSLRKTWLEGVGAVRPDAVAHLETGPWGAGAALDRKLVTELGDESSARRETVRLVGAPGTKIAFGSGKKPGPGAAAQEILRLLSGVESGAGDKPHIAVVPLSGSITMGASDDFFEGDGISERGVARTIQRLAEDAAVHAVVLRIDSPGGSALASDLLWLKLRELGKRKPAIASVGGMAASGGYYLASAAERILAEHTSIVGSIGVVGGKMVIGPALEPLGIRAVTLAPGADENRVSYDSPFVAWDDATRERVRDQMLGVYDLFVDRVAEGRHLPRARVLSFAEGRIFSGTQGLERGLVDALGGLGDALAWARKRSGLDAQAPVTVEGQGDSWFETLGLDAEANSVEVGAALERHRRRLTSPLAAVPEVYAPYLVGLSPLLGRERVLALMPVLVVGP